MHILTLSLHALFRALFTCKFADGHGLKTFLNQKNFRRFEQSTLLLHRAYVCIHVQARLRLCAHTRAGMIMPMCADTCGHERAHIQICVGMMAPMYAYKCGHDRACLCIYVA